MRSSVGIATELLIFYLVFGNVNFGGTVASAYYTYTDMLTWKYYKKRNNDYNKEYYTYNFFHFITLIIFRKIGKFFKL